VPWRSPGRRRKRRRRELRERWRKKRGLRERWLRMRKQRRRWRSWPGAELRKLLSPPRNLGPGQPVRAPGDRCH